MLLQETLLSDVLVAVAHRLAASAGGESAVVSGLLEALITGPRPELVRQVSNDACPHGLGHRPVRKEQQLSTENIDEPLELGNSFLQIIHAPILAEAARLSNDLIGPERSEGPPLAPSARAKRAHRVHAGHSPANREKNRSLAHSISASAAQARGAVGGGEGR